MSTNYGATFDQEEAPYIPTHGEFKLDSGYSVRMYTPVKVGTQDTDEESNKYWVLPYDDTGYATLPAGVTLENRFKTGYIDYDIYSIAEGIGGYAPDIRLAVHGGPIPLLNYCAATATIGQVVAPHPSGFTDWVQGRAILGKVMEHGAPTGEQCLVFIDMKKTNTVITETLTSPTAVGTGQQFAPTYTGLVVHSVFDVTNQLVLPPALVPTAASYNVTGVNYEVLDSASVTGLTVTYEYDASA